MTERERILAAMQRAAGEAFERGRPQTGWLSVGMAAFGAALPLILTPPQECYRIAALHASAARRKELEK
jgi:hypothetical protein